jgi:hydroxyacylglutathione hydrolase
MDGMARQLFRSIRALSDLPDYVQLWPGHGAGSACGKSLGAMPQSTLGYEKAVNWAFAIRNEDDFAKEVLAGQPSPPSYFATMKRFNRDGPALLATPPSPRMEPPSELERAVTERRVLVDVRRADAFRRGHVRGALSIPLGRSFAGWAGWILPYDQDVYLIVDGVGHDARAQADRAALDLAMIGLDRVGGYFTSEALDSWEREHGALEKVADIDPASLREKLQRGELRLVDVRAPSEWDAGHIDGASNIPLGELAGAARALADTGPVVLQCAGGSRSTIASSILLASGNANVVNLEGGLEAWRAAGLPLADSR